NNLAPGRYIILAIPYNDDLAPGYYKEASPAVLSWLDATQVDVAVNSQVGPEIINLSPVQLIEGNGIISGKVILDTTTAIKIEPDIPQAKEGIAGAIVITKDDKNNVRKYNISNIKGNFKIDSLENGKYNLIADKIGFAPYSVEFEISQDSNNINQDCPMKQEKPTGVKNEEIAIKGFALVYPNPSSNDFTIEFQAFSESTKIIVIDMLGRLVQTKIFNTEPGLNAVAFNSSRFSSGSYIIKIETGSKMYSVPIIIK
ncbi:MAG: T9SS type A sorting domain-containing protein, partial [Bacteroidota bacterium]